MDSGKMAALKINQGPTLVRAQTYTLKLWVADVETSYSSE